MRKIIVLCLLLAAIAAASLMQVNDGMGRLLLSTGFPNAAAALVSDPAWKGVAYYTAHRWVEAAGAFRRSRSPGSNYNLANALAQAGQYAAAIDAYDVALAWNPQDVDAGANKRIVMQLTKSENDGHDAKAEKGGGAGLSPREATVESAAMGGTGNSGADEGSFGGGGDLSQSKQLTLLENNARIGPKVDASSANPDQRWLKALPDKAGAFLKLRIAAEHERRVEAGLSPPPGNPRQ